MSADPVSRRPQKKRAKRSELEYSPENVREVLRTLPSSSTAMHRSAELLRCMGYFVDVCETVVRRGPYVNRHDLHGFADLHAFSASFSILVQATTSSGWGEHVRTLEHRAPAAVYAMQPDRGVVLFAWFDRFRCRVGRFWGATMYGWSADLRTEGACSDLHSKIRGERAST